MAQLCLWTKIRSKQWLVLVRRLFNVWMWFFCAPNATILLVYIPAKIEISFIWKVVSLLPKSASSTSRLQAHFPALYTTIFVRRKDKINYLSNQTWAIHEIITSWRKKRSRRSLLGSVLAYQMKSQVSSPRPDIKIIFEKYFFGNFLSADFWQKFWE